MNSFYSEKELKDLGLKSFGKNVNISKKVSIYGAEKIEIGNNVRIDDFCLLSGEICLGNYIHISAYSALYGANIGIDIHDFVAISAKTTIFAVSDDFSGEYLTNPMIDAEYRRVQEEKVTLEKHVILGCGCVVLPGVVLREGSAFGSMSLVKKDSEPWSVNWGTPAVKVRERSNRMKMLETEFLAKMQPSVMR